jgi:putative N6-adenine-specific DNA methylase
MHTGAISERVLKAISSRLGRQATEPPPGKSGQGLFIRAIKDHFTLSIDSSGENLYKRGIKTHGGRAPLRETTAASILKLAGYQPERPLLDPMCGSGSFSIEAAMMSRRIPPGWYRDFAFMHWPAFRPRQWAYIRQAALGGAAPAAAAILASDKDPTVCRRLSETLERCDLCGSVQVVNADFFHMPLPPDRPRPDLPGLIVLNPPYGRRIGSQGESQRLIATICDKLISDFKGWRFAILAPPGAIPDGFSSRCHTRAFHHGGLKLVLHIGIIGSGPPSGYH